MNINAISNNAYQAYAGIPAKVTPSDGMSGFQKKDSDKTVGPSGTASPDTSENSSSLRPTDESRSVTRKANPDELSEADKAIIEELKKADREVRNHEMAHVAVGGRYVTTGANFSFKRGPDGINYAVGGEVGIDSSPIPGDPEATIAKMRQVKQAALAPANPSSQDIKVASMATAISTKALSELMLSQARDQADKNESKAFASHQTAADSYTRIRNLPDQETSSFNIAV